MVLVITIGKSKIVDEKTKKPRAYRYSDIPKEALVDEFWVNDLKYLPIAFDLLELKLKDSKKIKSGWWDGTRWEGLRLKPEDIVISWKRIIEFEQ